MVKITNLVCFIDIIIEFLRDGIKDKDPSLINQCVYFLCDIKLHNNKELPIVEEKIKAKKEAIREGIAFLESKNVDYLFSETIEFSN